MTIGVVLFERDGPAALAEIEQMEALGVPAVWRTTGAGGLDAVTLFAAAAVRTERIRMGTSIIPSFPRHPIVAAQQALVLGQLAPGRFRLGVGSSHQPMIENMFGMEFERPLEHLREYVTILKQLLHEGASEFQGSRLHVNTRFGPSVDVPVMISALRKGSFELAGTLADGAITWIVPYAYLQSVALPAMRAAAERAGRPVPPLIVHVPVAVFTDRDAVLEAARARFGYNVNLPFYRRMLVASGFPEAGEGRWTDAMLESIVVSGEADHVAARLREIQAFAGEVIADPLAVGPDPAAARQRTIALVAGLARP
jgi:F420-dependent oxidoreductase-like protein